MKIPMTCESTFFCAVVPFEHSFRSLLKDMLIITRATIDPAAGPADRARLVLQLGNDTAPICDLDGKNITSVALNIPVFPGVDITFTVRGTANIHVTGFYEPKTDRVSPFMSTIPLKIGKPEEE